MTRVYGFFVTRVYAFRDEWAIQIEQWHREQLGPARAEVDRLEMRAILEQSYRAASAGVDRLEARLDRLECQVLVQLANLEAQHRNSTAIQAQAQEGARTLGDHLTVESTRLERSISDQISRTGQVMASALDTLSSKTAEMSTRSERLSAELAAVTFRTTQVEALLYTRLAKQLPSIPADSFLPESEEALVQLAESLAFLRPLVPYPKWRFDSDWYNPDLCFQVRQRLWQHFVDRRCEAPVRLPWHLGTHLCLCMTNDLSRQVFIAGCTEPNEFAFLDRFLEPGMTFIDVGANEGIYSVFAARRVGPSGVVWAFEPSARELGRLRRNAASNELDVSIFPVGLSDSERDAELVVAENLHAWLNTLGKIPYAEVNVARTEHVQLLRLDDVVSRNPLHRIDIIKIDIEGGELNMLRGAVETLRRYRPLLLFELLRPALVSQGASPEEVIEFLHRQEYTLYEFDSSSGLPTLARPIEYGNAGWSGLGIGENLIAVPEGTSLPAAVQSYVPVSRMIDGKTAT